MFFFAFTCAVDEGKILSVTRAIGIGFGLSRSMGGEVRHTYARVNLSVDTTFAVFTGGINERCHVPFRISTSPFCSRDGLQRLRDIVRSIGTNGTHFTRRSLVRMS